MQVKVKMEVADAPPDSNIDVSTADAAAPVPNQMFYNVANDPGASTSAQVFDDGTAANDQLMAQTYDISGVLWRCDPTVRDVMSDSDGSLDGTFVL